MSPARLQRLTATLHEAARAVAALREEFSERLPGERAEELAQLAAALPEIATHFRQLAKRPPTTNL